MKVVCARTTPLIAHSVAKHKHANAAFAKQEKNDKPKLTKGKRVFIATYLCDVAMQLMGW